MSLKFQVTFDCAHAGDLASFWAAALDGQVQPPPPEFDSWQAFCEAKGIEYDPGHMSAVIDPEGNEFCVV